MASRRGLLAALPRLSWAEHRIGVLPGTVAPRRFEVHGGLAVRRGTTAAALPPSLRSEVGAPDDADGWVVAPSRARIVRTGQMTRPGDLRVRSFYVTSARSLTLKLQAMTDPARPGIARELAARRKVAQLAPELAPGLQDAGTLLRERVGYLLEEVVDAPRIESARELRGAASAILAGLARLHAGVGVTSLSLSRAMGRHLLDRWDRTVAELPEAAHLAAPVRSLVLADRDVEVSLGHGDVVASNILMRDGAPIFVDWEFARLQPVAVDIASLLTQARVARPVLAAAELHHGEVVGRSSASYSLAEQLALAQVQMLTYDVGREAKARAVGRLAGHRKQRDRRIASLTELLGLAEPRRR